MKWQLTSVIICLSFAEALTVRCHTCSGDCETNSKIVVCSDGCVSSYDVGFYNGQLYESKSKACTEPGMCVDISQNLGYVKATNSFKCCSTDLCNTGFPDADLRPNGKKCHFCIGDNCLGTVHCEGIEDHCITSIDVSSGKEVILKGCVSKSLCDLVTRPHFNGINITQRAATVKCCEGNFCNSAESIPLSFFLMSLFLLPSFLIQ